MPKQRSSVVSDDTTDATQAPVEGDAADVAVTASVEPAAPADAEIEQLITLDDWLAEKLRGTTGREIAIVFAQRYGGGMDAPSRIEARFQAFLNAPA